MYMSSKVDVLNKLISDTTADLAEIFDQLTWAEEEIDADISRFPKSANRIYHSFILLTPTHELMRRDFVYRSHCREILERVVAGDDTRPGTAAEVVAMCSTVSLNAPLSTASAGLYHRMWTAAFPHQPDFFAEVGRDQVHYEALVSNRIDELEAEARRKLAVADRKLAEITCGGLHYGDPVDCEFTRVQPPKHESLDATPNCLRHTPPRRYSRIRPS